MIEADKAAKIHQILIKRGVYQVFREVNNQWELVSLTPIEYKILIHFIDSKDLLLTRNTLIDGVWGAGVIVTDRTVDSHICTLRKKLGPSGDYIRSIYGQGYIFISK